MPQRVHVQNWYQKPSLQPDALGVVRFTRLVAELPLCGSAGTAIAPAAIATTTAINVGAVNITIFE